MVLIIEGQEALFDDEDRDLIEGKHLYLFHRKGKYYVLWNNQRIHRIILGVTSQNLVVDHKNGNPLDNRRSNLRICVQKDNSRNRTKSEGNYTSRYKGVYRTSRSWVAQIRVNYQGICLGTFETENEAAIAYNNAAIEHFGEFAKLNSIVPIEQPCLF